MQPQFQIIEVLNARGGTDHHSLIFKILWGDSKQTAYMQFDMARKKYPLIVLDYLASRIKQKPLASPKEKPVVKVQQKKHMSSPITNYSDSPIIVQKKQQKIIKCPVDRFFQTCTLCQSKNTCTKMLDYDALVPIQSNFAYPVFFKLNTKAQQTQNPQKNPQKQPKPSPQTTVKK